MGAIIVVVVILKNAFKLLVLVVVALFVVMFSAFYFKTLPDYTYSLVHEDVSSDSVYINEYPFGWNINYPVPKNENMLEFNERIHKKLSALGYIEKDVWPIVDYAKQQESGTGWYTEWEKGLFDYKIIYMVFKPPADEEVSSNEYYCNIVFVSIFDRIVQPFLFFYAAHIAS